MKPTKKSRFSKNYHGKWRVWYAISDEYSNFEPHTHEGYEFYLHVKGGELYQIGSSISHLSPLQLFVAAPGTMHGCVSPHTLRDYERLIVQIHPDLFSAFGQTGMKAKKIIDDFTCSNAAQVHVSPHEYLHLRTVAAAILPPDQIDSPITCLETMGSLSILIGRLCRCLMTPQPLEAAVSDHLMHDVRNYILKSFAGDCSLDALAARFNVSKYHLSHRFSETYGMSIHQYLQRCRITYAQLLIRQGEQTMDVFPQCGFNDYSSFNRAFERISGMSPREWRKSASMSASDLPHSLPSPPDRMQK